MHSTSSNSTAAKLRLAADLHRGGDFADARRLYREVIEADPMNAEALHLAGAAAAQHGSPVEAVELLTRAARIDPRNPVVHANLAATLGGLGRVEAALAAVDTSITLHGAFAATHRLQGDLLRTVGRLDAAVASYERAAALLPRDSQIRIQRGDLLAMQDRLDEALRCYDEALAIDDSSALAHKQRGVALTVLQRHPEALRSLDRAVELEPESADTRYTRAVVLLATGDYAQGFREHEWRWRSALTSSMLERRSFEQPLWLGEESLAGRRILLYSEQGLGDTLQFCRYANLVADRGAAVVLQVQRPLVELLRRSQGVTQVVAQEEPLPVFDCHCPLMTLPLAFKTRVESIPGPRRYLSPNAARVAAWQHRLGPRDLPRVGLMWNGNPDNLTDRYRSFPLAAWLPHLPSGFRYYSLQRFVREEDRQALRCGVVCDLSGEQQDFEDAAALCACMDVVISVCTSIAHLSGALGLRTWVLLSQLADWRWLLVRKDSPWYPTARLYRQASRGNWSGIFARVAADLVREIR
jgi:tetratricopeptide (TPR) repeat protein